MNQFSSNGTTMDTIEIKTKINPQTNPNPKPKLLVTVLTSKNITYLRRAIKSITNQNDLQLFNYFIIIIINSNDENYRESIYEKFPNFDIFESSSSSYLDALNIMLQIFKNYDYLSILDAENYIYYPTAFHQFYEYIDKFSDIDIFHTMCTDIVMNAKNTFSLPIAYNFRLFTVPECHLWKLYPELFFDPMMKKCQNLSKLMISPSKMILCNRNVFPSLFSLSSSLLSSSSSSSSFSSFSSFSSSSSSSTIFDLMTFLCIYEGQCTKQFKSLAVCDLLIYVRNSKPKMTEEIKLELYKIISTKNKWNFNDLIKKIPYGSLMDSSGANIMDNDMKLKYCYDEIVQVKIQDIEYKMSKYVCKISSMKINKYYHYLQKQIMHYISKFYNCGMHDPQTLMKIYQILCDINYKNAPFTHKIATYIFNHYPCIYFLQILYESSPYYTQLFIQYAQLPSKLLNHKHIKMSKKYQNRYQNVFHIDINKPTIMIYFGYLQLIHDIELCEQFTEYFNVIIISNNTKSIYIHHQVHYIHETDFNYFNQNYDIHHFIIFRFISCILDLDLSKIDRIYLIIYDVIPNYLWRYNDNYLPYHGTKLLINFLPKIRHIICFSEWHKHHLFLRTSKIQIIPNGIDTGSFHSKNKEMYKFIYADPKQNLRKLCSILLKLREKFPEITLHIYHPLTQKLLKYIQKYNEWVHYHSKVKNNEQLIEELLTTNIYVYPMDSKITETFSYTCLQAMAARNVIITADNSSLNELVQDIGIIIPKHEDNIDAYCEQICNIYQYPESMHKYQQDAYNKSKNYDWNHQIRNQWMKLLLE